MGMLMTVIYFGDGSTGLGSGTLILTVVMAASYVYLRNATARFPKRGWTLFADGLARCTRGSRTVTGGGDCGGCPYGFRQAGCSASNSALRRAA